MWKESFFELPFRTRILLEPSLPAAWILLTKSFLNFQHMRISQFAQLKLIYLQFIFLT